MAILLLYIEFEFINIIRIKIDDIYIFRFLINHSNIVYFVVEYEEDEFEKGDITVVCRLVE